MRVEVQRLGPQSAPNLLGGSVEQRRAARRSRAAARKGWLPGGRETAGGEAAPVVSVVLIGGERLTRGAAANLLAAQEGFEVQGTFESAVHFLASDLEEPPGVLLFDCDDDPADCRPAVSVLSRIHATAALIMFCQEASQATVRCAMEYRVSGMILKSYSTEDIRHAITYMASGRTIMPAGWQRAAVPIQRDPLALSPRRHEVLRLIAQGLSNEEIATSLALSPNTVKFHVRALYARLGVHNRVEASIVYGQMTRSVG